MDNGVIGRNTRNVHAHAVVAFRYLDENATIQGICQAIKQKKITKRVNKK